ncbi:hypothetical protein MAIT1_05263 [Magnetofaba australis IT-1]|uniref:Transposase n=1 Tax=Magnetofaba australis IT-1 TaxID=1434232 RepID=A0A1Y2K555_9PROT|nr:hypothetical protein MAIT1_05263 [Magnetofaba australis IT-1]
MRFVGIKSVAQQEILALHRIRSLAVKNRTALVNQIRGLLAEYGIVFPKSIKQARRAIVLILSELHRGQGVADGDQQAGKRLSSHPVDSWGAGGVARV